jgi:hypothetical protein
MAKALLDAFHRQRFQMAARLAQTNAFEHDLADLEFLADEMIERHAVREEIAPRLVAFEPNVHFTCHRLKCLAFDERHFPIRAAGLAERAFMATVTISNEAVAGNCPHSFDGVKRLAFVLADVNGCQVPVK